MSDKSSASSPAACPPHAHSRLPRIIAGARRGLLARLLMYGLLRAMAAFAVAFLLREATRGTPGEASMAVAGLMVVGVVILALRALERRDGERLGQDFVAKTRLRLFARITAAPLGPARRQRLGTTLNRMISDLGALKSWVSRGVATLVVGSTALAGALGALAVFTPAAVAPILGLSLAVLCVTLLLSPSIRARTRDARRARGRLAAHLGEVFPALSSVVQTGNTRREWRRLRRRGDALAEASVRRVTVTALTTALPDAAFPIGVAILVTLSAGGRLGVEELVGALALLGLISTSLRDLSRAWTYRIAFVEARHRINQLLDAPVRRSQSGRGLPDDGTALSFELDGVTAGGLRNVSLRIEAGERVVVSGPAGGGRESLAYLAARLCDPMTGTVRVGGRRLARISAESLARRVRIVSSELALLRGTVASNIRYGLDAQDAGITEVAALCGIDTATLGLRVEEGAGNLSPELRARIGLARALAARPGLLVIDDPVLLGEAAGGLIARVLAGTPATIIVVSHDADADADAVSGQRVVTIDGAVVSTTGSAHRGMASIGCPDAGCPATTARTLTTVTSAS